MSEPQQLTLESFGYFEAAATLIATIAFPSDADEVRRHEVATSVVQLLVRMRCQTDREWAEAPQIVRPIFFCRSDADLNRDLKQVIRRFRSRVQAGHTMMAFLMEAESGQTPKLPGDMTQLSLNKLIDHNLPEFGDSSRENIKSRSWRPSLPVIHLCCSYVQAVQEIQKFTKRTERLELGVLFNERSFLERVVTRAEAFEPFVVKTKFKLTLDDLIRFRIDWVQNRPEL